MLLTQAFSVTQHAERTQGCDTRLRAATRFVPEPSGKRVYERMAGVAVAADGGLLIPMTPGRLFGERLTLQNR